MREESFKIGQSRTNYNRGSDDQPYSYHRRVELCRGVVSWNVPAQVSDRQQQCQPYE